MSDKKNVPKIRFPGFTEPWEQRKLGEIATFINGRAYSQDELLNSGKYKVLRVGNFYTNDFWYYSDMELDDKYYAENGDLLYTWSATFGPHIWHGNKVIYHYHIWKIELSKALEKNFALQLLERDKQAILSDKNGSTMVHITKAGMERKEVLLPKNIVEQVKIGQYFTNIDHLITLHQRKLEHVKKMKKSMLQKMFPKKNQLYPEVRFPGFTDAWEQRKLEDIYGSIGNAFVGTATPYYVESGHFYLESNNIKDGQINHNTEVFINDEFYEKQKDKWLHTGDMVMVQSGHVGHAAVIPEELNNSAAHALIMFRNPKKEIEPYFLNYQYQTLKSKKKIENITTGNTIKHILASEMQQFEVDMPELAEQKKIAEYFRALDHLITLHQRELDHLQLLKKGMLQQMFI